MKPLHIPMIKTTTDQGIGYASSLEKALTSTLHNQVLISLLKSIPQCNISIFSKHHLLNTCRIHKYHISTQIDTGDSIILRSEDIHGTSTITPPAELTLHMVFRVSM